MKTCEVYKITNLITNKVYIGITNQGAEIRFGHHLYEARSGSPFPIHNSMRKYGNENFKLEVIDTCDNYEDLKNKEKYWISFYNSKDRATGYNLTEGGDGTFGRLHSEETKEKIRQKAIGRKISDETKAKMSKARKGRKASEKTLAKINERNLNSSKAVLQYDTDNNLLNEYISISEAARQSGMHRSSIINYLKGKLKGTGYRNIKPKFIWKYKE